MWQKILGALKDAHVPIAIIVFAATSFYHFHTKVDLGPNYCNSIYAMYGFLAGHAWVNKDKGDQQ